MSYPQVVRVFATTQDPDYDSPWQSETPSSSTGSGVVIQGHGILTGAHVVANATFLQVQKISNPAKVIAHVRAVCHDSDLALLDVTDPSFYEDVPKAEIGELPDLRDKVSVVGFPVGGEEISITEGVVSRVEVQRYSHSQRHLLAVTVDAAINKGNSGGPVFRGARVVGIAFQKVTNADNIGELVPAPLIRRFLDGAKKGRDLDVPGFGIATQNLENPLLRAKLGMKEGDTGILVTSVQEGGSAWGRLRAGDALLEIDGAPISNNGTIRYLEKYRTRFDVMLGQYYAGDAMPLTILRDGKRKRILLTLRRAVWLVPRSQYDQVPSYVVYGGLVFQPLTRNFLATWDKWRHRAPKEFLYDYYLGRRTKNRQEALVLSQILADELTIGYGNLYHEGVAEVCGKPVRNMRELVTRLDKARGAVEVKTTSGGTIMLDVTAAREANPRILERYNIPRDRSTDLG
jgi:S1-C subfamily serine protease